MARPNPYIARQRGDLIQAEEWNEIQIRSREAIESHNHTGDEKGIQISSDGIAAGSITLSHLATEFTGAFAALRNVRVIVGKVNEKGETVWGDGFKSEKTNPGEYHINFDTEFSGVPVVIACCTDANTNQKETVGCANVSASGFDVRIWRNTDNVLDDDPFDFIALGPK